MQDDQTTDNPPVKRDWAAIRAENEAAFQAGLDRVSAAYTEQRETPWKQWQEDFKAEMRGRAAMRQVTRQLIAHGTAEAHANYLATPAIMISLRSDFNEAFCYKAPLALTAIFAVQSANHPLVGTRVNSPRLFAGPAPH